MIDITTTTSATTFGGAPTRRARRFGRGWTGPLAGAAIVLLALIAFIGPNLLGSTSAQQIADAYSAPGGQYLLGSDELGRDILPRVVEGLRYSLSVATAGMVLAALLGLTVGLIAGYVGGRTDEVLMRIIDIQMAVPQVLLVLVIVTVLRPTFWTIAIALALSAWYVFARVARAQVLSLRENDMVAGHIASGLTSGRIVVRHVLPNISGPLIAIATLEIGHLILAEATLGYLGLGIAAPAPSLGSMVAQGQVALTAGLWWPALIPGIAITILILTFNGLGDWMQHTFDPRQRRAR